MSDRYTLNETRSPIDPSSWRELNENWELIKSYLRFIQRQINLISGADVEEIINRIESTIADAENATASVEQAKQEIEAILDELNTLITGVETATENANIAASNANELNTTLTALKSELETLQTNLNSIVQAEAERVSNETNRTNAEQVRATDETTRRENEAARVLKEQSRENAEQNRKTTFDAQMLTTEQKITMMQYLIDNLKSYDFDLSATYNFPNLIKWNGSTFIALKEVTGLTPVDDAINYRLVAQRGVDGTGAVSSVNGFGPDENGNVEVIMALVNNLVSDSTTAGLTAAQGKALKVLFDGLQQILNSHVGATDNPHGVTAEQIALGNVQNFGIATQAEAEEGVSATKYMTSQRTKQAIDKNLVNISQSINDVDTRLTQELDGKAKKHWLDITEFGAVSNSNSSDAIQAAIDFANTGDVVYIPGKKFILDKTILLKSGIKLIGAASSSVLKMKDGANLAQMLYLPPNAADYNYAIELSNFQIDGNKANNPTGGHGILLNTTYKAFVKDVKVSNVKGKGIFFSGNAQRNTNTNYVKDCIVYGCDEEGVYFDEYCSDMHIYGGDYGYSKLDNVRMNSPSSSIRNCTVWGSREGSGLNVTSYAPSLQAMNNQIEGNAKHGVEIHSSHVFIEGNKIYDNSEYGNANLFSGIYISSPSVILKNITINNNKIYSGLYAGNGIHKHAIEFADANHTKASIFGNSMKYTGNDEVDYTREIVKGLKIGEDATDFSWINTHFHAHIANPQIIPADSWTRLKFDAVSRDIEAEFEVTNNRFVAKHLGYYQFELHAMLQNQVGKQVILEFWVNDTVKYRVSCEKTISDGWYTITGSLFIGLAKGNTLSAHIFCGGNDETFSGTSYTRFTGKVIR